MKAGGIESIRWPLFWAAVQPTKKGGSTGAAFDQPVEVAARAGLQILPSIGSPPPWVTSKGTTMRSTTPGSARPGPPSSRQAVTR